jgi:hypothetical protein
MTENCIPVDCLEEVKEQHARLRVLVRELLLKNQELRDQLATTQHSLQELHPSGSQAVLATVANRRSTG